MFNIVDRYIGAAFLSYFFSGLAVFIILFLAVDFLSTLSSFDAPFSAMARYYGYLLPSIIQQMVPIAALMGTVFTLSQLNGRNELVVLYSCGLSLWRLSWPILILVGLLSALNFLIGEHVIPTFNKKKNYIYYVEIKKKPHLYSLVKTNKIWYRSRNTLFNIKTINPEKREAQGLTLYYFDSTWKLVQMITAARVQIFQRRWNLYEGTVTVFAEDTSFPLTQDFTERTIIMGEDVADLTASTHSTDVLNLQQMKKYIQKNKAAGLDTTRYEVDYQAKFGFAMAALVMSLIGIPFSVGHRRGGGLGKNIGLCLGLAFLYLGGFSSAITMGHHGVLHPLIAAWLPNLVFLLLGGWLLWRKRVA